MQRAFIIAALGVLVSLGACAHTAPAITSQCLPLKTYTLDEEKALAAAAQALDPTNPLIGAMADYGAMRAADRACQSSQPSILTQ